VGGFVRPRVVTEFFLTPEPDRSVFGCQERLRSSSAYAPSPDYS
jgi:hypothetical protein